MKKSKKAKRRKRYSYWLDDGWYIRIKISYNKKFMEMKKNENQLTCYFTGKVIRNHWIRLTKQEFDLSCKIGVYDIH
jgi:hypothetical protein